MKRLEEQIRSCARSRRLSEARLIHKQLLNSPHRKNIRLHNLLMQTYGHCGSPDDALAIFNTLPATPNSFSHTIMLRAFLTTSPPRLLEAQTFFNSIPSFDIFNWNIMLNAYSRLDHLEQAHLLFKRMIRRDVISWGCLIAGYSRSNRLAQAGDLLRVMPFWDKVTCTAVLQGYAHNGHLREARGLFETMAEKDLASCNAMIVACGKNAEVDYARELFLSGMSGRDSVTWTLMMITLQQNGCLDQAKVMFDRMPMWDSVAFTGITTVFAASGDFASAKRMLFGRASGDVMAWNTVLEAYASKGHLQEARSIFSRMSSGERNTVTWSIMIQGHAEHGRAADSIQLFHHMLLDGLRSDFQTFMGVLTACAHLGMVASARDYIVSMTEDHEVYPDHGHYSSMVNVLAKAGQLDRAEDLLLTLDPSVVSWTSFLDACRTFGDRDRASRAASFVLHLDPGASVPYSLCSEVALRV